MKPLLTALALLGLTVQAAAQAPVFEPMPEGSQDVFVGLGLAVRPRYEGAARYQGRIEPMLQASWSNGLFVSGAQAGWHLGNAMAPAWPRIEWGPLLNLQAPRDEDGRAWFIGSTGGFGGAGQAPGTFGSSRQNRLLRMDRVEARLEAGMFFNLRQSAQWRLTQSVLAGSGADRRGLRWNADLHYLWPGLPAQHSLSATLGLSWANASVQRSYFGVSEAEALRSGNRAYRPGAGLGELNAQLRWNVLLHPDWVLSNSLRLSRLQGDAARSPLVDRPGSASVSVALVHRF